MLIMRNTNYIRSVYFWQSSFAVIIIRDVRWLVCVCCAHLVIIIILKKKTNMSFDCLPNEILNIIFKFISYQDIFNFYIAVPGRAKISANYYLQQNFLYNGEKKLLDFDRLFLLLNLVDLKNSSVNSTAKSTTTTTTTMTTTTTTTNSAAASASSSAATAKWASSSSSSSIVFNFIKDAVLNPYENSTYKIPRTVKLVLPKYDDDDDDNNNNILKEKE